MASMRNLFLPFSAFILFITLFSSCEGREYLVGGSPTAWSIPHDNSTASDDLNRWAKQNRFQVGDFLIWKYNAKVDSVLEVTEEDYKKCNSRNATKKYDDGNTKVELLRPGPYYFISGASGHCLKGEKLHVVVLSKNHSDHGRSPSPAPAPSKAHEATTSGAASHYQARLLAAVTGLALLHLLARA